LAYFIIGGKKNEFLLYVGAVIIIITVILGLSNTRPVKKSGITDDTITKDVR
jgi:C4-dicarboxylate transporter